MAQEKISSTINDLAEYAGPSAGPLRALAGGITFNNADEIEAWLRSKLGSEDYTTARDRIRQENEQYSEDSPIASTSLNLAGSILPAILSGPIGVGAKLGTSALAKIATSPRLLASTARSTVAGAATGAASGFGEAKEMEDAPGDAASYGLLGAGIGAAAPTVLRTAGGTLSAIKNYFSPNVEKKAAQFISEAAERGGITPRQIEDINKANLKPGVTTSIGDTNDELRALVEKVARRGDKSARELLNEAESTINQQPGRIQKRLKDDLGAGDYYDDASRLNQNLRTNAPTWYGDAYAHGDVDSPVIRDVLKNEDFANAFEIAKDIAKTHAASAQLRGEDPSKYILKNIYEPIINPGPVNAGEILGYKITGVVPNVMTLDYMKRGIDVKIRRAYAGEGANPAKASALEDLRAEFLKTLDDVTKDPVTGVSKYAVARKRYGDEKEISEAFEVGKNDLKKMDYEEIEKYMDGRSDAGKHALRTGWARTIYDDISKAAQSGTSAAKAVSGDFVEAKHKALFDDEVKFDLFKAAMKLENDLHNHAQQIVKSVKQSASERAESSLNEKSGIRGLGNAFVQAMSGNVLGGARSLTYNVVNAISNPGLNNKVAARLTKHLLEKNPEDVGAAVTVIEKYAAEAEKSLRNRSRNELAAVSGLSSSVPPKDTGKKTSLISDENQKILEEVRKRHSQNKKSSTSLSDEDEKMLDEIRKRNK